MRFWRVLLILSALVGFTAAFYWINQWFLNPIR